MTLPQATNLPIRSTLVYGLRDGGTAAEPCPVGSEAAQAAIQRAIQQLRDPKARKRAQRTPPVGKAVRRAER